MFTNHELRQQAYSWAGARGQGRATRGQVYPPIVYLLGQGATRISYFTLKHGIASAAAVNGVAAALELNKAPTPSEDVPGVGSKYQVPGAQPDSRRLQTLR